MDSAAQRNVLVALVPSERDLHDLIATQEEAAQFRARSATPTTHRLLFHWVRISFTLLLRILCTENT